MEELGDEVLKEKRFPTEKGLRNSTNSHAPCILALKAMLSECETEKRKLPSKEIKVSTAEEKQEIELENTNEIKDKNTNSIESPVHIAISELCTTQTSTVECYTPKITANAEHHSGTCSAAVSEMNKCDIRPDNFPNHSMDRRHLCEICKKEFSRKGYLKLHMLVHTGEQHYVCSICKKEFSIRGHLKRHMLTHMNQAMRSQILYHPVKASFKCSYCGLESTSKQYLIKHCYDTHKDNNCNLCNRQFPLPTDIDSHMATQHSQYLCGICDKECPCRTALETHVFTHSKEKRFTCSICDNKYTTENILKKHIYSHAGEVKYICSVCGKIFHGQKSLNMHMYIHSNEKSFLCTVVPKHLHNSLV